MQQNYCHSMSCLVSKCTTQRTSPLMVVLTEVSHGGPGFVYGPCRLDATAQPMV